jgi:glycerol uptake facilitator-like aquaporin
VGLDSFLCSSSAESSGNDSVHVALSWGFAYTTAIFVFSHLSGALINPAIVVSLVITRNMGFAQGLYYIAIESE